MEQDSRPGSVRYATTAAVAMDLDEITTNSKALADYVKEKIDDDHKGLQAQISRLSLQLSGVKNRQGGANKSSASDQKKKKDSTN